MELDWKTLASALAVLLFLSCLPLSNWLWIARWDREEKRWETWLKKMPHSQQIIDGNAPICSYCGSVRIFSRIEYSLPRERIFGLVGNKVSGDLIYRSFRCSGCGTEIYRTKNNK